MLRVFTERSNNFALGIRVQTHSVRLDRNDLRLGRGA
jgi:hypothetical protein